jgi:hypothetical protein
MTDLGLITRNRTTGMVVRFLFLFYRDAVLWRQLVTG